jgi:hypoxanthine phosphoribosyltransferase
VARRRIGHRDPPCRRPRPDRRAEAQARGGHGPGGVLVVDDNADAATTLAHLLTLVGQEVERSNECGFAHHLVKPVDLAALQRITARRNGG